MMDIDRRDFLKTAAAAASVAVAGSAASAFAADAAPSLVGIIYTKEQPGHWKDKEASHAPQVKVEDGKVAVVTPHPMSVEHYIVRHTLVLADGTVAGAKTFTATDRPESSFELPKGYKGKIRATSFCNQHDFWLTEAEV